MRKIPPVLAPAVYIPGLLYEALIRARGGLYAAALLPQHRLSRPVISIGNITMGGAGKTPLVIHVAQTLLKSGFPPAVLSRGYGRRNSNASRILPPGKTVPDSARALGDEPTLIRRRVPSAWMGISKNRRMAGQSIAKQEARAVFLLDDGFQHRRLYRDLDIVIVDRLQPLGANRVFPRGTLREPVSGLQRCQIVVINGMPEEEPDPVEAEIRSLCAKAAIFHCRQTIQSLVPFMSWNGHPEQRPAAGWPGSAYLVAALGNPDRFRNDVRQLGIEVRGIRFFADHHWLRPKDWIACVEEARNKGADAIVITEKDAIKISQPPDFPLLVSVQTTEISDTGAFELALINPIKDQA